MTANRMYKAAGISFSLLVFVFAGMVFVLRGLTEPASPKSLMVTVEIKNGMSTSKIAALLKEKGAIRSSLAFVILTKLGAKSDKLKAGDYEIDSGNDAQTILARIVEGKSVLRMVTIPEGLTLAQIARLLSAKGICDESLFIKAASRSDLLVPYGIPGRNAEGYLMPETYGFRRDVSADEIVGKMVALFFSKTRSLVEKFSGASNLSLHQILTLASIIQKEAASYNEMPLVSAVFHNRLRIGMPLQADPTVIYANPEYDGAIHKKDLSIDSPYNTYKHRGLPPGPIANPGLEAISAAYSPAQAEFLYFVAMGGGKGHYFSSTLDEHNRAVRKFILNRS
ncbi:MAG: endolytic transglycosylase MltG [Nitrospinae bacterium]|nr:endolytic transglycosylase MltG [Nitrospinota bacterium]